MLVSSLEVEAAIYPLGVSSNHEIEVSYEITYTTLLAENGESHWVLDIMLRQKSNETFRIVLAEFILALMGLKSCLYQIVMSIYLFMAKIPSQKGLIYAVDAPLYI